MNALHRRSHSCVVRPEWLALRQEEIIEPDLADRRCASSSLVPRRQAVSSSRAPRRYRYRPQHRRDGVHGVQGDVPQGRRRPALRPVGEVEFANGIAAMSASGEFGPTRVAAGIVGYADLGLGGAVREVLEAEIAAGGGRFRGVRNISAWHPMPEARGSSATPPPDVLTRPAFREGLRCSDVARADVRRVDVSHPARRAGQRRPEHPRCDDHSQSRRRRARDRSVRRPARRSVRGVAQVH